MTAHSEYEPDRPAVPVFFLSDSTGISAETMGNALLIQFPDLRFDPDHVQEAVVEGYAFRGPRSLPVLFTPS